MSVVIRTGILHPSSDGTRPIRGKHKRDGHRKMDRKNKRCGKRKTSR
jgi:hypothetical protein